MRNFKGGTLRATARSKSAPFPSASSQTLKPCRQGLPNGKGVYKLVNFSTDSRSLEWVPNIGRRSWTYKSAKTFSLRQAIWEKIENLMAEDVKSVRRDIVPDCPSYAS